MANWPPNTLRLCSHTLSNCCFQLQSNLLLLFLSSFGFIYLLTAQTACLHLTIQAPTADKERNWSSCYLFFFPSYHIAQPHLSFKRAPLSVPWKQWLQKLAQCHPCSFHCLILQNPLTDCDVRRTIVWVYQKVILLYSTVLQKQTSWNLRLADDLINWSISWCSIQSVWYLLLFSFPTIFPFALFSTVDDNFDAPLFSLSFSLWDPFAPFQRWPHLFFSVPLYYFWWSNGTIHIYRHTLNPRRTQWSPRRQRRQGPSQQCQW